MSSVVVLLGLYYLLPLGGGHLLPVPVLFGLGSLVFVLLAVWEIRGIFRAPYPVLRAIGVLALLLPLFILTFAAVYFVMQHTDTSSFSEPLTRTDALYFAVTVFATVGFGDIVARSEAARTVVMLQMIGDLVVIGVLVRLVVTAAQRARKTDPGAHGDDRGSG